MRTKYLFSAALLASVFAACTNEDLVTPTTDAVSQKDGRPTVNVKLGLDFGNDATTRLAFDQKDGYRFEVGDQIGALLMDEIPSLQTLRPFTNAEDWAKLSWLEKYSLTNYIHTDYPFACTEATTNGGTKWESNAKMLEGNYFFAYPYEGYSAKRQLSHSIINQKQDGGTLASAMKSYADNQFFIGYAQIMEGNETKEALTKVSMTSVLGAVRFQLKNIGTRDQKVTKIVLSGTNISSVVTFDPTDAQYTGADGTKAPLPNYNLRTKNSGAYTVPSKIFNYANYLGLEAEDLYEHNQFKTETDYVYNIPETEKDNYKKGDALRAVVKPYDTSNASDNYAELALTENGEEGIIAKANGDNVIEACVMINPITVANSKDLLLSIYTTEGLIKNIDLSKENEEQKVAGGLAANTVITNQAVKNVGPEVRNVVELQFDNNSVQAPVSAVINNSDDLKQYVGWISKLGNKRLNTVELANSSAIDAETAALLKKENVVLYVKQATGATNAKLQLANEAGVEDVLNNIIVDKDCPIEVLGTANIGSKKVGDVEEYTLNYDYKELVKDVQQGTLTAPFHQDLKIEVAKGGTLNVIGTKLGENVIGIEITNNDSVKIAKDAVISKVKVTNNAIMKVDGSITMAIGSVNGLKAEITVGKKGMLSGTTAHNFTNEGIINNYGQIWNIINNNNATVKPATVNIYSSATVNSFNKNEGVIVYDTLKTAITFDQKLSDAIRGIVKYTTKYGDKVKDADKKITTKDLIDFNVTALTITEGKLTSNTGRPDTPAKSSSSNLVEKVDYEMEKTPLTSLIVDTRETQKVVTIDGKAYPLLMRGNTALIQINGDVKLGTSIIAEGFDTESYITGNVTVTDKVAIATEGEAVFTRTVDTSDFAFDHSEFTAAGLGKIMKGAKITVEAGKFFAVQAINEVSGTSNSVDAVGVFQAATVASGISVSGNHQTTLDSPLSDK